MKSMSSSWERYRAKGLLATLVSSLAAWSQSRRYAELVEPHLMRETR